MDKQDYPTLEVDIAALIRNWRLIKSSFTGRDCAAVVKANAYGLGMPQIAQALAGSGCKHFFVASIDEGIELRQHLAGQFVYVLNGVTPKSAEYFLEYNLIPVLNNWHQLELWERATTTITAAPAALHVNTGMNRLGFSIADIERLALEPERIARVQIRMIMSHLACADEPSHPLNQQQLKLFQRARRYMPTLTASFANSGGIFLGRDFHHDLARPGCALYGINPMQELPNPVENIVNLTAPILQIYTSKTNSETVGYGAKYSIPKGTRIATIAIGYADGILRRLAGTRFGGYLGKYYAPLIGQISMDLITLDISRIPDDICQVGQRVSLICAQQDVNMIARQSQTIGYEIFTSLGKRVKRIYTNMAEHT